MTYMNSSNYVDRSELLHHLDEISSTFQNVYSIESKDPVKPSGYIGAEGLTYMFNKLAEWINEHPAKTSGTTSDGYHTFDELYHHRTILFASLVNMISRCFPEKAWKSWKHSDGTMYDGMFIAGIYTQEGQVTYHCEARYWPMFLCQELNQSPKFDGHTSQISVNRLQTQFTYEYNLVDFLYDGCEEDCDQKAIY